MRKKVRCPLQCRKVSKHVFDTDEIADSLAHLSIPPAERRVTVKQIDNAQTVFREDTNPRPPSSTLRVRWDKSQREKPGLNVAFRKQSGAECRASSYVR